MMSLSGLLRTALGLSVWLSLARLSEATPATFVLSWKSQASSIQSMDFIVNPGVVGTHAHVLWGGSAMAPTVAMPDGMRSSACTSSTAVNDFSAYWTPHLYYGLKDGTYMSVSEPDFSYEYAIAGASDGAATSPFPDGLRMIAGSPTARSPANAMPIEQASWTCLDDSTKTSGFPIGKRCKSLQGQLVFPSCSTGKAEAGDFKSHMAYPSNDSCPSTHPTQVPVRLRDICESLADPSCQKITFKVTYDLSVVWAPAMAANLAQIEQPLCLSQGDCTGYGWHGDFAEGWQTGILKTMVTSCRGGSSRKRQRGGFGGFGGFGGGDGGAASACPQVGDNENQCRKMPVINQLAFSATPMPHLPGCNTPNYGPTPQGVCSPTPPATLVLDQSYASIYQSDTLRPFSPIEFIKKIPGVRGAFVQQKCKGQGW